MGESAVERYLLISPYRLSTIRPGASTVSSWPNHAFKPPAKLARQEVPDAAKQPLFRRVVTHPRDFTRISVVLAFEFRLSEKSKATI